jgi:hypothetical protein
MVAFNGLALLALHKWVYLSRCFDGILFLKNFGGKWDLKRFVKIDNNIIQHREI